MATNVNKVSSAGQSSNFVPVWKCPLISILLHIHEHGLKDGFNLKITKEKIKEDLESASASSDTKKGTLAKILDSVLCFVVRRNPVEAGGILAAVCGLGNYILSKMSTVLKMIGFVFMPLGVIGVIAGKVLGVKLDKAEDATKAAHGNEDKTKKPEPEDSSQDKKSGDESPKVTEV